MSKSPTQDVPTSHAYDGIKEFDNPLPRWWLATFYGTVVFSIGYWFFYHTLSAGQLPTAAYQAEVATAEQEANSREQALEAAGKGVTEEQLWQLSKDPETLASGESVYKQNCAACHGDKGQGLVGPNLTDPFWLHGSTAKENYKIIASGVLDKGMPAWKPVLGLTKVKQVQGFLLTLRGKNLPGKEPQGTREEAKAP